jgi:ERCC4-related helicase
MSNKNNDDSINQYNFNLNKGSLFKNFNNNSDFYQEYDEEEYLKESMDNLSINNSNNSNNLKSNININFNYSEKITNSKNTDLFSSNSTDYSSINIFPLSPNAQQIYQNIYDKENNIKNSIIISEEEDVNKEIYIKIIDDFYVSNFNLKKNIDKAINKICFLVIDSKKIDKLFDKLNEAFGKHKKVMILQGGKGKKKKSDYNKFLEFIKSTDIFIAIPDVFYKLLSIGFIKINQLSILFIDDCHLCEANHPLNMIMQEFYYYYLYRQYILKINQIIQLPNILGFTSSPFFDKRIINNDTKCKQLLTNISENLNCQMIISPKLLNNNNIYNNPFSENNANIEYIQVESHLKEKKNFEILYKILNHYFFEKMIKLSLKSFINQNPNINLDKDKINNIGKSYLNLIEKKFFSNNFEEFIKIDSMEQNLRFLSQKSYLFRIFEDLQKFLIIILQNLDIREIVNFFDKHLTLYKSLLNQNKIDNNNIIKELKYLVGIIEDCSNAFLSLLEKKFVFNNDRLNKFMNIINKIYTGNKYAKIIVFVPTRKLAYSLNEYLNRNNMYKSEYIAGVNTKKDENNFLSLSTRITNNIIIERNKKFNEGEANILISTPSVYDILQIQQCDYIIIFSELSNSNSDYIRIKYLANNNKSKLIILTLNQNDIKNFFMQKIIEHDNKLMNFFEPNEIVKDFRVQNFYEEKLQNIGKQSYYYIEETQAKVSIRNSIMLFNEINNWFFQHNKKLVVNKYVDEIIIDKVKKYKCKIELNEMFNELKIFSHTFGDKQAAEGDCYLQLISFLHKKGIIDNNLKISDKYK